MKTWFITGCSTGFGRDLATAALKRGHRVAVTARNPGENRRQFRVNAGKEAGDSERAAAVILDVVDSGDLPERLPLGNFAYDGILEHFDHVRADIQGRELLSRGADRPEAA
jgi:NAD(P)-dependent dehydrogenase (short-subunit alcohol dehydrogenase family)